MGFGTMDQHDVPVVAPADGIVCHVADGNYDRCHGTAGFKVTCDGHPIEGNGVHLRHADGLVSEYWHFKKNSVQVKIGQQVLCGQLLGYVGSSGRSASPHIHFEVRSSTGEVIDPYAGVHSQPESYWTLQPGPQDRPGTQCAGALQADAGPIPPLASSDGCGAAGAPPPSPGLTELLLLGCLLVRLLGASSRRSHRRDLKKVL